MTTKCKTINGKRYIVRVCESIFRDGWVVESSETYVKENSRVWKAHKKFHRTHFNEALDYATRLSGVLER